MLRHFAYIILLLFTLSYPLYKSFEEKIRFHKKFRFLLPAILCCAAIFIPWDIWFTSRNVWQFNTEYVLGWFIAGLPVEEWLFFFIVPFACIFIYEVMNYFVKRDMPLRASNAITLLLGIACCVTAAVFYDRLYTIVDFGALGFFLLLHRFVIRSAYMGRFYRAWVVCIVPFLIVDGFITGLPIAIYNNLLNTTVRIYCIPLEDLFYGMLQVLATVTVYEFLKRERT